MAARLRLAALLLAASLSAPAQAFDHTHAGWDRLVKKHVAVLEGGKASRVRYAGLAGERTALAAYLAGVSAVQRSEFDAWPAPQQMAFLINAYNAFTAQKVLSRYPDLRSIWDFGKLFGNPFKDEFFVLLGERSSLDRIEHRMLRRSYREPRVHYALNCAAIGCPMLREEAYSGAHLERQLEEQAGRFLSDRSRNRFRDGRLEVSRIFDWFGEDFEPRGAYFARYAGLLAEEGEARAKVATAPISFLEYDWGLNDAAGR